MKTESDEKLMFNVRLNGNNVDINVYKSRKEWDRCPQHITLYLGRKNSQVLTHISRLDLGINSQHRIC